MILYDRSVTQEVDEFGVGKVGHVRNDTRCRWLLAPWRWINLSVITRLLTDHRSHFCQFYQHSTGCGLFVMVVHSLCHLVPFAHDVKYRGGDVPTLSPMSLPHYQY